MGRIHGGQCKESPRNAPPLASRLRTIGGMSRVAIVGGRLEVGGSSVHLLSGELHFWRVRPEDWRRALEALVEMGLPIVSTYVCWEHHELSPGRFDFTGEGDSTRDLVDFLRLADSLGLKVFLRPGPYIYAEWRNLGVPDRVASLSRMSEAFRAEALVYLRAIFEAVQPHLATCGGPIVLWQADNEIDVMPWAYERELGAGNVSGMFQQWLEERYGGIDTLNERWGTRLSSFADARPIQSSRVEARDFRLRHLDWTRFRQEENTRHARWMVETCRELGVDVPIVLNSYPVQDSLDWRALTESAQLFGIDPYPSDGFRCEPDEHRIFVEKCLVQSTLGATPYIAELESGVWRGHERYTGQLGSGHYRLMCLSALAAGIQGWNWYMAVERDNWRFSPIDVRGEQRQPLFEELQGLASLFADLDPPALSREVSTAAFHDSTQAAFPGAYRDDPARSSLYAAGVPYSLLDLAAGTEHEAPLLYYSGHDWLSREGHERLLCFVREGGRLVLPGRWPRFDEKLEPLDLLGIPLPDLCFEGRSLSIDHEESELPVTGRVFAYGGCEPPGTPILARPAPPEGPDCLAVHQGLLRDERYCVGFERALGEGRILWLGFTPGPEATLWIHHSMHAPIAARALTPRSQACLLTGRGGAAWLIVLNLAERRQEARVLLGGRIPPGTPSERLHGTPVQLRPLASGAELTVSIPAKDAVAIRLD